ncbi:hypothetical protein PG997_007512 [Apiospora hydei]|uniref:FHA domain-containing protein n=1 Tax=Apiospora hydei TaxID=1337664 RepID=A0ABR1W883_9PEZI
MPTPNRSVTLGEMKLPDPSRIQEVGLVRDLEQRAYLREDVRGAGVVLAQPKIFRILAGQNVSRRHGVCVVESGQMRPGGGLGRVKILRARGSVRRVGSAEMPLLRRSLVVQSEVEFF